MPCENCVNRREFIATAGVAGLVVLSGCGDGQLSGLLPTTPVLPPGPPAPLTILVGDFPGLANLGELVKVGTTQAAKRTGTNPSTFDAFSMRCTHQGCRTSIVNGETFHCGCHQSNFANDGSVINGPFTGETIGPLQKLATSYDPATDELTIG